MSNKDINLIKIAVSETDNGKAKTSFSPLKGLSGGLGRRGNKITFGQFIAIVPYSARAEFLSERPQYYNFTSPKKATL